MRDEKAASHQQMYRKNTVWNWLAHTNKIAYIQPIYTDSGNFDRERERAKEKCIERAKTPISTNTWHIFSFIHSNAFLLLTAVLPICLILLPHSVLHTTNVMYNMHSMHISFIKKKIKRSLLFVYSLSLFYTASSAASIYHWNAEQRISIRMYGSRLGCGESAFTVKMTLVISFFL